MPKIERALISVSDKTDLVPFAEVLSRAGVEIISTGGTARALREAGIEAQELSDYTGFPVSVPKSLPAPGPTAFPMPPAPAKPPEG